MRNKLNKKIKHVLREKEKQKKNRMPHARRSGRQLVDRVRSSLSIVLAIFVVTLVVAVLFALVHEWNRSTEVRRCFAFDELGSWGSVTINSQQEFVRWNITTPDEEDVSYQLRGPLSPVAPRDGEIILYLDSDGKRSMDKLDIRRIQEDPFAYRITATGLSISQQMLLTRFYLC